MNLFSGCDETFLGMCPHVWTQWVPFETQRLAGGNWVIRWYKRRCLKCGEKEYSKEAGTKERMEA